jgi:Fe2+ or Zn2+ uptake regulation protein
MKKHKDLLSVLRSNEQRITPARSLMLQYILDRSSEQISLKEIHAFLVKKMPGIDRSSIYRNLESFKKLNIIKEIKIRGAGKQFQYIFDRKIHVFKFYQILNRAPKNLDTFLDKF